MFSLLYDLAAPGNGIGDGNWRSWCNLVSITFLSDEPAKMVYIGAALMTYSRKIFASSDWG